MSNLVQHSFPIEMERYSGAGKTILRISHLYRAFADRAGQGKVVGLQNLCFDIRLGDITAIIGESGSGKSTLLRCIYGLLKVDGGEILFHGKRVKGPDEQLIPGHPAMRMVSQHFDDLNTYANVWDNVASGLSNTDLESKRIRTQAILKRLRIDHLKEQRIADLSGGEKQRAAIARALISGPEILLMDEPFNQIDSSFRDQLQQDIRALVDETGLTVLLVSHDPAEVMGLADYLILLQQGRLSAKGRTDTLYQRPPNVYAARIFCKSNILSPLQAAELGLDAGQTALHPEWIRLHPNPDGLFLIHSVLYRGFYEEIFIQRPPLDLRVIQLSDGKFKKGQKVDIQILNSALLQEEGT